MRKKKFNPKDLETELTTKKEKKNAAKERDALPSVEPFIYKVMELQFIGYLDFKIAIYIFHTVTLGSNRRNECLVQNSRSEKTGNSP